MRGLAGRVGTPMPVGNEGAGTVVAAGGSPAARAGDRLEIRHHPGPRRLALL